jgi:hypothetical protein
MKLGFFVSAILLCSIISIPCIASELSQPEIFPLPQKVKPLGSDFVLNEQSFIALADGATEHDAFLAGLLRSELSDRYGFAIKTKTLDGNKTANAIVMGSIANPLVRAECNRKGLDVNSVAGNPESYLLKADSEGILIAGGDDAGAFYGLQSVRQIIRKDKDNVVSFRGVLVEDRPYKPFRGIRLYMPGRDNIPFFKRFLRDFMALYKFNKVILEVSTCMRLDRHPEINAGWIDLAKELKYSRRERPDGPKGENQDSANHDAGDGGIVEKADVADVVQFAQQMHIEVIPEIPSLTHSYYLLTRHRELAEIQAAEWPDTYCPSNPDTYKLLFDVIDECVDVIKPKMVHIGHDEWRMPINVCPRCKGIAPPKLFAEDVNKIYDHLKQKNIQVSMYGDHLVESVRGKQVRTWKVKGQPYQVPGALSPEEVKEWIPKDILIYNWFWDDNKKGEEENYGQQNDLFVEKMGFEQVFNNMLPNIQTQNWPKRSSLAGVIGGVPSSWAATTEFNFGKDLIYEFLGCENLLWSTHWPDQNDLRTIVQDMMPDIRQNLRGTVSPSLDNNPAPKSVDIAAYCNASAGQKNIEEPPAGLLTGKVKSGPAVFELVDANANDGKYAIMVAVEGQKHLPGTQEVRGIKIGKDVSSLIFLHACARPAKNEYAYRYIYNYDDTADLLGFYEMVYEDGLAITVPIRYGVNILEWNADIGKCLYGADKVNCSQPGAPKPAAFYAFEWTNPRFGRKIMEVNLIGSHGFKGLWDKVIKDNAVALIAIDVVEPRSFKGTPSVSTD